MTDWLTDTLKHTKTKSKQGQVQLHNPEKIRIIIFFYYYFNHGNPVWHIALLINCMDHRVVSTWLLLFLFFKHFTKVSPINVKLILVKLNRKLFLTGTSVIIIACVIIKDDYSPNEDVRVNSDINISFCSAIHVILYTSKTNKLVLNGHQF